MVFYFRGRWRILLFLVLAVGVLTLAQLGLIRGTVAVMEMTSRHLTPVFAVERPDPNFALTLDAVWTSGQADEILSVLEKEKCRATFFLGGYFLERYPEVVKRIASGGHEIGNTTFSYPHLTSLTAVEIGDEIAKNHALIKAVTGLEARVFRPPFGEFDDEVLERAGALGYQSVVWSVDTLDWRNPPVDLLAERLTGDVQAGSIVLLHVSGRNTAAALAKALPSLRARGLRPVVLSELLHRENYYVDQRTGMQRLLPGAVPEVRPRRRFWLVWPR